MTKFGTLLFLDRFKGLFEKVGIDYGVMRRILYTKLLMDRRRIPTLFNQSNKKKNADKDVNHFLRSLWIYALLGLILIPFIVLGENYIFQMTLVFSMMMFIVMTSMISDFSSVLLDIRDQNILYTKPVKPRTISTAKTLHICIYLFFLTVSIVGIPLIVGLFVHGVPFFLIFIVEIILVDLLIVFLTALLYFLILQFFDGEKLKDLINYVQIGLSIAVFVGYQVVIRAFDFMNLNIVFDPAWWHFFLPPVWFGAPFAWILNGMAGGYVIVLSLLALIVPIVMIVFYVKLMPAFERNLQKLSDHSELNKKRHRRKKFSLARFVCPDREERTFFRFAGHMINQEREFKLKVYPSLGFSIVMPFIFLFTQVEADGWGSLSSTKWYLTIYGSMIMIPTVLLMLNYSGAYKGAWIFKAAPVGSPEKLYKGTVKAAIARMFVPVYMIISFIFILLFGWQVVPDLIVAVLSTFIYAVICFKVSVRTLPFSESFAGIQQSEGVKVIPLLLLIGAFVILHLVSASFAYGIYVYMIVLAIVNWLSWKWVFKGSWAKVGF